MFITCLMDYLLNNIGKIMKNAPHQQQFNKKHAMLCGQGTSKNLTRRIKDYNHMIESGKGKDYTGYHKPGSLKK